MISEIVARVAKALYKAENKIVPWDYPGNEKAQWAYVDRANQLIELLKKDGLVITDAD